MITTHLVQFLFFTGAGAAAVPPMEDIPHPFKRRVALRDNRASRPRRYGQETVALKRPNPCRDEQTPLR